MKSFISFLQLRRVPANTGLALLALRLFAGLSMLLLHGWDKVANFSSAAAGFPDAFGIGSKNMLALAVFSEVFCSALLVAGLFTRLAALAGALAMGVAFFVVNGARFSNAGAEAALLFLAGYVALLLAGGGKFSVDGLLWPQRRNDADGAK
jgi:putative oxidoreductase